MAYITNRWTIREEEIMKKIMKEHQGNLHNGFRHLSPILNRDWRAIKSKYYYNHYNINIVVFKVY